MDEITFTLNSPITEEQWDAINDVDFEYTNEITFHTKHGKEVKFVKASAEPERKRGRWIRMYSNRPKQYTRICSECGEISWFCGIGDYNYCPWCGTKMDDNYRHLKGAEMRGEEG